MAKLVIILIAFTLVGCNRRVATPVVQLKDSTRTDVRKEYIREEVQLPPDSSYIKAYLECDSLGNVLMRKIEQMQGERVSTTVNVEENKITVIATDRATQQVERTSTDSISGRQVEVPVPFPVEVRVNYITGWQWFQIYTGRIAIALFALAALYKALKSKFKPILKLIKSNHV